MTLSLNRKIIKAHYLMKKKGWAVEANIFRNIMLSLEGSENENELVELVESGSTADIKGFYECYKSLCVDNKGYYDSLKWENSWMALDSITCDMEINNALR